ncbi:hypothetical protein GYA13_03600 [Candidatus Kuenenbacteria bacterium]|nr:hypothetical protein [Candidatus Kuenenbacteria bacterium]
MNGENQVEEDKAKQEEWRQEYQNQLLQDRARQNLVRDNYQNSGGIIGREAGKLADKETFKKFEGALGKGAAKIKAQEHSEGVWMIGLGMAIAKDLLDIATLESASWFDWIIDAMLGIGLFFLFGRSAKLGARLIKSVAPAILEMVPGIGFLPIWSLSVAYMYFKSQQEQEE